MMTIKEQWDENYLLYIDNSIINNYKYNIPKKLHKNEDTIKLKKRAFLFFN
jgi:hypothetical protein